MRGTGRLGAHLPAVAAARPLPRDLAGWTFEHYDIRKPGDPLVMQCAAPHEDGHKQVQCHRYGNRLRKDQAISYEVGPEKEMWCFHLACDARPIIEEEL